MGIFCLLLYSCTSNKNSVLITKRIQYDVQVRNSDPDAAWWVQNIVGPDREILVKSIMEAAYSGKIRGYDYFNKPLTADEIRKIGTDTLFKTLQKKQPPYEEYDTLIISRLQFKDITMIRFLEEWYLDQETLEIEKKVLGIAPVVEKDYHGETYKMPLFWLYMNDYHPEENK